MEEPTRNFQGVWIPAALYLDPVLTWTQKLILVEVHSFTSKQRPCYVSNEHLANFCQVGKSAIEKAIRDLVKQGILHREQVRQGQYTVRYLSLVGGNVFLPPRNQFQGGAEPVPTPLGNNSDGGRNEFRPTNTVTSTVTKPITEGVPISVLEVIEYFENELNLTSDNAEEFTDYYSSRGWRTKTGPLKDWKAAARNWARRTAQYAAERKAGRTGFNPEGMDTNHLREYIQAKATGTN